MPAVSITLDNVCSRGNHITVTMTGDWSGSFEFTRDDILNAEPLSKKEAAEFVLRAMLRGLTPAQARNRLQAGVVLSVTQK